MSYLYGDSTPSNLEVNYIELVRDSIEFCVQLLLADHRILQGQGQLRERQSAAAAEIERLERLQAAVASAVAHIPAGLPDSPTARCASAITRSAAELARAEVATVRTALTDDVTRLEGLAAQERQGAVRALEALLVKHDLPDSTTFVQVQVVDGARNRCLADVRTGFGLQAMLEVEPPEGSLWRHVVRVDRLMERLEIHTPEVGGWLHKEIKMKPHRLERLHVFRLAIEPGVRTLVLRVQPDGSGGGFDITFRDEEPRVQLLRVEEGATSAAAGTTPFAVPEADAGKLIELYAKLAAAVEDLLHHRKVVLNAMFKGQALGAGDTPAQVVEQLVATLAPVVQEIAARSQSPGELVLRRLIGDDRREEIFVPREDLRRKLEPLPPMRRPLFEPLWVTGRPAGAPPLQTAAPSRRSPLFPPPRLRRNTPLGVPAIATPGVVANPVAAVTPATASAQPPGALPEARSPVGDSASGEIVTAEVLDETSGPVTA
jgi:hypothetical protein